MPQLSTVAVGRFAESKPLALQLDSEKPFRILLAGDFSGGASHGQPVLIDRDNFDRVLDRVSPELHLAPDTTIKFRGLEDFHPDRLCRQLPAFEALRQLRARLSNPATFRAAAAELQEWLHPQRPAEAPPAPGSLLDQILEQGPPAQPEHALDDFDAVIRRIVAPHLTARPDPRQAEVVAQVDEALSDHLRAILHHPDFQGLEAAWRAAFFLVSRLETPKVYLLDLARAELAKLKIEESVWNIVAANYTFEPARADAALLIALAKQAARADVPLLAAAHARAVGCESFGQSADPDDWSYEPCAEDHAAWQALRRSPDAAWIGLALPRFLLRLPYGKETSPLEEFPFEEMPGDPAHEHYLWGNPAVACALLMVEDSRELESLPVHVYRSHGLSCMKPCAEALLTDRAAERILDYGVMPLLSVRDYAGAVMGRFQSLADPPQPLRGRWH